MTRQTKIVLGYLPVVVVAESVHLNDIIMNWMGVSHAPIKFLLLFTAVPYFLMVYLYDWIFHKPGERWMDER